MLHGAHITIMFCENKQRPLPFTTLADWFFVAKVENAHCAVRNESLHKTDTILPQSFNQGSDDNLKFLEIRALYVTFVFN
jgi:hypothetical protein